MSLSWLIPEFYECWWDSVFADVFGANLLGALLGFVFIRVLKLKSFNFIGDQQEVEKSTGGMDIVGALRENGVDVAVNLVEKFVRYRANFFFRSPFRLISGILIIIWSMISELTTFLIMHAFDLKPGGYICISRLVLIMLCGVCAIIETHDFMGAYERQREAARTQVDLPTIRLGRNTSLVLFITLAELKLLLSMGRAKCDGVANAGNEPTWSCGRADGFTVPANVWIPWAAFVVFFVAYATRRFRMGKHFDHQSAKERFLLGLTITPLLFLLQHWEFSHK